MRRNKWTNNHKLTSPSYMSIKFGSYSSYLHMCSLAIDIYNANEYRQGKLLCTRKRMCTCAATAASTLTNLLTKIYHPSFLKQTTPQKSHCSHRYSGSGQNQLGWTIKKSRLQPNIVKRIRVRPSNPTGRSTKSNMCKKKIQLYLTTMRSR